MDLALIETCLKNTDSRYRAVIVAARRAKQLQKGALPIVQARSPKPIATAVQEVSEGKIGYRDSEIEETESDIFYQNEKNSLFADENIEHEQDYE